MLATQDRYRTLFVSETRRRLTEAMTALDQLAVTRGGPTARLPLLEKLSREVHTIKGSAASMHQPSLALLAHALEDLCVRFQDGTFPLDAPGIQILRDGLAAMEGMIAEVDAGHDVAPATEVTDAVQHYLRSSLTTFKLLDPNTEPAPTAEPAPHPRDDDAMGSIAELMAVAQRLRAWASTDARLAAESSRLEMATRRLFAQMSRQRQESFETLLPSLRRRLRDLCDRNQREANLDVRGEETLMDPLVLSRLQGVLSHLLSNAIKHGIEPSADRRKAGKPAVGRIHITLEQESENLLVTFGDDGRGFDGPGLRARALAQEDLSATDTNLPTRPYPARQGRSGGRTAEQTAVEDAMRDRVTTIGFADQDAGRGEGLPAARAAVEALGGTFRAHTNFGKGSRFELRLPMFQRIEELLLIEDGGRTHALLTRILGGSPDDRTVKLRDGGVRRVDRVVGTFDGLVCPPPFPFNLLPQVNGTTISPDGTVLFVVDPATFSAHPSRIGALA